MDRIYQNIKKDIADKRKLLAVLIDPDKMPINTVSSFITKVNTSMASHIFVGGSEVEAFVTDILVEEIKKFTQLPVVLFPGDILQITNKADGILFLSLISGRNPEYLIGKHVKAVSNLKDSNLEVLPTGYILIENGKPTAVERISQTAPLKRKSIQTIVDTSKAGELLGMKIIYLEAGSGATHPIEPKIISAVKQEIKVPLIVGGGIRDKSALLRAYEAGADLVVIGTAFEKNEDLFNNLQR